MPEYCASDESKRPPTPGVLNKQRFVMTQAGMANSFSSALCTIMVHYRSGAVQLNYYLGCGLGGGVDLLLKLTEGRCTKTRTGAESATVSPESSITPTVRSC